MEIEGKMQTINCSYYLKTGEKIKINSTTKEVRII